jgi:hypothetical protein
VRNAYTSKNESRLYRFDHVFNDDGERDFRNDRGDRRLFSGFLIGAVNDLNCPLLDIEVIRHLEMRVPMPLDLHIAGKRAALLGMSSDE